MTLERSEADGCVDLTLSLSNQTSHAVHPIGPDVSLAVSL
jgi:hypothetical protein